MNGDLLANVDSLQEIQDTYSDLQSQVHFYTNAEAKISLMQKLRDKHLRRRSRHWNRCECCQKGCIDM